jgi:dTDP-4-amino-4,6-dideoxygalactose transaminase
MINLFNITNHILNTNSYSNLLHDKVVNEFENTIANYVGAKYAVSVNSATSAIFLALLNKNITLNIPTMIPPVVLNAIITSGNKYTFEDNVDWVGDSYVLHNFKNYKIVDSAQKIEKNQFKQECNSEDLMIFSFYPTKPIGSCDGGMIVSDDLEKINYLRELSMNGMSQSINNWERDIKFPGYKMYMNSIQCEIGLRNFKLYPDKLKKLETIRNSNHLYRINVENRNQFINFMKSKEITCGIHYECMHNNNVYKINDLNCPKSEIISKKTVSIPFHENLTESDLNLIIKLINEYNG